jgi:glycerol-3-phosphate dehydrogenase
MNDFHHGRLGPAERAAAIARAHNHRFDVVVVGGGVTGAGAALDAASRGLSVALVEARDLASGTSSRSGKTLHGGLRYLQQLNFSLVRQAAHERNLLVSTLAPYLAHPTRFLIPLEIPLISRGFYGAGVALYDLMGGLSTPLPRHRHLGRARTLRTMPALRPDRVRGGIQYSDAIVDDARLTMVLARTAAANGAVVITGAPVTGMTRSGGRVTGVSVRDTETGDEFDIAAGVVINAAGVWAEDVQELGGESGVRMRPAKGIHLVVPADRIESATGLIAKTADSVLVVRPWAQGRFWIIGTTDTPYSEGRDDPTATQTDVDYLLGEINGWLTRPLGEADVLSTYAGLRPLVTGGAKSTAQLSRDHSVLDGPDGLVTVVGGKYTTYRAMAKDAVQHAIAQLGIPVPDSQTARMPLVGVGAVGPASFAEGDLLRLGERYGSLLGELDGMVRVDPTLADLLVPGEPTLGVEVAYAASHEGGRGLDDVLTRRTHIAMETADHGAAAAPAAARILGPILGWDNARTTAETEKYLALIEGRKHYGITHPQRG